MVWSKVFSSSVLTSESREFILSLDLVVEY